VLEQLALAVLLERGDFDRHVRRTRLVYRQRRDVLIASLARHLPAARPRGAAAGFHLLVDLPDDVDEAALLAAGAARGVGAEGLAAHRVAPGSPGLILGYGAIREAAIEPGVRRLAEAVRAVAPPEPTARTDWPA
jgi:GntR family transcriptional regulator / MocR family aminotransferase